MLDTGALVVNWMIFDQHPGLQVKVEGKQQQQHSNGQLYIY